MDFCTIPDNPVPADAHVSAVRTADGVTLRTARFPAAAGRKGTVCILPGRGEFIEKYFEVVDELRGRGFAVAIVDWRGQGLSDRALADRRKGHVESFAEYDRDLACFMQDLVLPDCPPPFYALAHSMGGSILIRAAAAGHIWFNRMVLTGPMLGLAGRAGTPAAQRTARWLRRLGMGRAYVPWGGATTAFTLPFPGNPLTGDAGRYARMTALVEAHPQVAIGSPTVAWIAAAYDTMDAFAAPAYPLALRQPMLIVSAGNDAVVANTAIDRFAIRLRVGSHVAIPGAQHEIMLEQDGYRAQFWAAFDAIVPGEGG